MDDEELYASGSDAISCEYCGGIEYTPAHETEHIIPYWLSKDLSLNNIGNLCQKCHRIKSKIEEFIRLDLKAGIITNDEAFRRCKQLVCVFYFRRVIK